APPPVPPRPAPPPMATPARPSTKSTVAFGAAKPPPAASPPAARPVLELASDPEATVPVHPGPVPAAARPSASAAAAAATGNGSTMARKLEDLGLSQAQVDGVLALSRDVIERVVWEVVPDLAETIIREEIRRLTAE